MTHLFMFVGGVLVGLLIAAGIMEYTIRRG
jgi:hypothetical protein